MSEKEMKKSLKGWKGSIASIIGETVSKNVKMGMKKVGCFFSLLFFSVEKLKGSTRRVWFGHIFHLPNRQGEGLSRRWQKHVIAE